MKLSLPLNEDQKTRENEPERLQFISLRIRQCAFAIDNIVGTDKYIETLYAVAHSCDDQARGVLQSQRPDISRIEPEPLQHAPEATKDSEIEAADEARRLAIGNAEDIAARNPKYEAKTAAEIAEDVVSRADEAERDARTRQYMIERNSRQKEQEKRRKNHPLLARALDRVNRTLADVEEAPARPLPKITRHFTLEEIRVASDEYAGFCIACGAYQDTCEPDARNYKCEECGELQVFGADELVQMGLVD